MARFRVLVIGVWMLLSTGVGISPAQSREALDGYCEQGGQQVVTDSRTSITRVQRSFPNCQVTVYQAGTLNLAAIYSDYDGTPKANPFIADTDGYWRFIVDTGRYDVKLSGGGMASPVTLAGRVAGNLTLALSGELAAIDRLSTTGLVARTGENSWTTATGSSTDGANITFGSGSLRATAPRLATSINDANGNELLTLNPASGAVNELTLANAAPGGNPTLGASGDDRSIGLNIAPKGSGEVNLGGPVNITTGAGGSAKPLEVYESGDAAPRVTASATGKVQARVGNGPIPTANFMSFGGLYERDFTQRQTSGTVETALFAGNLTPNTLAEDGDLVVYKLWGRISDSVGVVYLIRVYFNTVVIDTAILNSDFNFQHYTITVTFLRTSPTSAKILIEWHWSRYGATIANNNGGFQNTDQVSKVNSLSVTVDNWTVLRQVGLTGQSFNSANQVIFDAAYAIKWPTP